MRRLLLLTLPLILGASGCSTFSRDWRTAVRMPQPPADIQGPWEGTWSSQTNGHHGRLRCLVSRQTDSEYLARFHANYRRILSFSYAVPLTATQANGAFVFRGEADLGRLAGGVYHYDGQATPTNFFSRYQAKADGGTFQMRRPLLK